LRKSRIASRRSRTSAPGRLHGREDVQDVAGVEADLEGLARVLHRDLLLRLAEVGVLRGDPERPGRHLELHRVGLVGGEQGDAAERLLQALAAELHGALPGLGDHLAVVGEEPLDEAHGEGDARAAHHRAVLDEAELRLALLRPRLDGLGEELSQLLEPLLREDDPLLQAEGPAGRPLHQGEAVAVGGDEAQRVGGGLEEDAVQVVAGLVGGDGEERAIDHVEEELRVDLAEGDLLEARERREVLGGQADDLELGGAAPDLEVVVRGLLERDRLLGQRLHDVVQVPRGHRDRALLQHLALVLRGDGQVEVGGGDDDLVLPRLEEDVGEDRHRALLLHDALRAAERLRELGGRDLQFHGKILFFLDRSSSRGRGTVENRARSPEPLAFSVWTTTGIRPGRGCVARREKTCQQRPTRDPRGTRRAVHTLSTRGRERLRGRASR
jgi:hypothetical protein